MKRLSLQRCFNHAGREAVAKCPGCGRFYCRECVTEHDDRLLCAECVRQAAAEPRLRRSGFPALSRAFQLAGAALLAWLFFYWMGQMLLSLDAAFHEGTVWKERWWPEH